MKRFELKT